MNENYGKLENGVLTFAPSNLIIEAEQVFNATAEEYLAAGYLPIKRTPKPNEGEWQAVYTEVDGVILQSWIYEGRIHDHSNLPLLEDVTAKSLSGVPAVHILPTDAKDGDMCLYAPQNTLTLADSGKKIYFDWEEFRKPVDESDTTEIYTHIFKNNGEVSVNIRLTRSNDFCECFIEDSPSGVLFQVWFTDGVFDFAHYGDTEYNSIEEIPTYYQLPPFDEFAQYSLEGNAYLFHSEYELMKHQGGEWTEAVEVPEISGGNGDLSQFIEEVSGSVNLYPPMTEGWTNSAVLNSAGVITPNTKNNMFVTPQIYVEPETTYSVSNVFGWDKHSIVDYAKGRAYTENGTVLETMTFTKNADGSYSFTTPATANYILLVGYKDGLSSNTAPIETIIELFNNRFMLVKGTELPSEYEPFGDVKFKLKNILLPNKSVSLENVKDDALPVFAPLAGKTIVNFGDSIFGNQQPPNDISTFLAEKSGATVYNCGFGGCRMSVHPTAEYNAFCMYNLADAVTTRDFTLQNEAVASGNLAERYGVGLERLKGIDFSEVDIVTIAYGTNDYTGVPLENEDNPLDTSTFGGALRYSIEKLLTAYPNLKIFVLSAAYRFWIDDNNEFTEDSNTRVNSIGLKLSDYNAKLKEVAAEYNLPYVDDYNIGIGKFNRYQYFNANDGAHHKEEGRKLIAEHLAKELY